MSLENFLFQWFLLGPVFFAVGLVLGKWLEAMHWREKGHPDNPTRMLSGGKFFYVVPEEDYEQLLRR